MAKLTYIWTPALDCQLRQAYAKLGPNKRVGAALDLMAKATGFPRIKVKERAMRLGITTRTNCRTKPWTEEDTMCLQAWAGHKPQRWIAKQLGRSVPVIQRHLDEIMFDLQAKGFTRDRVAELFGVDRSLIVHWVFLKEIAVNEYDRIPRSEVSSFFERRHDWLDLRMVDQRFLHRRISKLITERPIYRKSKQAYLVENSEAA